MLAPAHRRVRQLALRVHLLQGDAQAMPFADATIDTVVCTLELCSIPDDRLRSLRCIASSVWPGGARQQCRL